MAIPGNAATEVVTNFGDQFETNDFVIGGGGKLIRGLFDTMYSNKVQTILRELWANALDSHIAAGKPEVPFDCHLPTPLAPTFSVRDYGTSMTHERIMKEYTTIGYSSKDLTNDQTGQWGLGAKVPFALVDHFTITAWLDGERRIYAATMKSDGVPQMMHLSTTPSDEPQGIEVSFPVDQSLWDEFAAEAKTVNYGFPVPPNIPGFDFPALQVSFGKDNWSVYRGAFAVRQGCVLYPVMQHQVGHQLPTIFKEGTGILVDVPIGTVGVTLSREALSFTPETKKIVLDIFKNASEGVQEFVQDKINEAQNRLEAEKLSDEWKGYFRISPTFQYNGEPLNGIIRFNGRGDREQPRLFNLPDEDVVRPHFQVSSLDKLILLVDRGEPMVRRKVRLKEYKKSFSTNTYARNRVRNGYPVFIISNPSPKLLARMVRRLGLRKDQVKSITSIPDYRPDYSGRSSASTAIDGSAKRSGIYKYDGNPYRVAQADLPKDYAWVAIEKTTASSIVEIQLEKNWMLRFDELKKVLLAMKSLGVERELFLFTPAAMKRVDPDTSQNIGTILKDAAATFYDDVLERKRLMSAKEELYRRKYFEYATGEEIPTIPTILNDDTYDRTFVARFLKDYYDQATAAVELGTEYAKELLEKYPLIFRDTPSQEDVMNYIDSINEPEKKEEVAP